MGIDEGNLQVIDVDGILERCPITIIVILNLLVYDGNSITVPVALIVYDSNFHRTVPHYIMSCSVVS